jgi:hypothetical protein
MPSRNVNLRVDGTKLIIEVDLSQDLGLSASGKANLIASGTEKVPNNPGVTVGINVYRKVAPESDVEKKKRIKKIEAEEAKKPYDGLSNSERHCHLPSGD